MVMQPNRVIVYGVGSTILEEYSYDLMVDACKKYTALLQKMRAERTRNKNAETRRVVLTTIYSEHVI